MASNSVFKSGVTGGVDPDQLLRRYKELQGVGVQPAELQAPPPPVDPELIRGSLERAAQAGIIGHALGQRTPNWYGVMHGRQPSEVNQGATEDMQKMQMVPVQAAEVARAGQMEQQKFQNENALNRQKFQEGVSDRATKLAGMESEAQGAERQRTFEAGQNELQRSNDLTKARISQEAMMNRLFFNRQKLAPEEEAKMGQYDGLLKSFDRVEALIKKHGTAGPLLRHMKGLGLVERAGKAVGVTNPDEGDLDPDSLANDASALQEELTYQGKEYMRTISPGRTPTPDQQKDFESNVLFNDTDPNESVFRKINHGRENVLRMRQGVIDNHSPGNVSQLPLGTPQQPPGGKLSIISRISDGKQKKVPESELNNWLGKKGKDGKPLYKAVNSGA